MEIMNKKNLNIIWDKDNRGKCIYVCVCKRPTRTKYLYIILLIYMSQLGLDGF